MELSEISAMERRVLVEYLNEVPQFSLRHSWWSEESPEERQRNQKEIKSKSSVGKLEEIPKLVQSVSSCG